MASKAGLCNRAGVQGELLSLDLSGDFVKTPLGNTGLNSQDGTIGLKIDWLTICWEGTPLGDVTSRAQWEILLDRYLGVEVDWSRSTPKTRGHSWTGGYRATGGADYLINERENLPSQHRISLPGQALGAYPASVILDFTNQFFEAYATARVTRIDLALDDYTCSLSPHDVIAAYGRNEHHGFDKGRIYGDMNVLADLSEGWTLGFGSRTSDKYYRYYNKDAESKGAVKSWRLELESKGRLARGIFERIRHLGSGAILDNTILDIITGGIDFRVGTEKNIDRMPRCPFWQEWLDKLAAAPFRCVLEPVVSSIQKKMGWLEKQAGGAFFLIIEAIGIPKFIQWVYECSLLSSQVGRKDTAWLLTEFWKLTRAFETGAGVL